MTNGHNVIEQTQFLTFLLADEVYAVSILRVKEIIEYGTVTRVPNMPPSVRGVINLRGAVVPVVDLVLRFKLGESKVTKRTCVIIAEFESEGEPVVMGLMADAVNEVIDLPPAEIEPPPSFGAAVRTDFLKGLGKAGKKFVSDIGFGSCLVAGGTALRKRCAGGGSRFHPERRIARPDTGGQGSSPRSTPVGQSASSCCAIGSRGPLGKGDFSAEAFRLRVHRQG